MIYEIFVYVILYEIFIKVILTKLWHVWNLCFTQNTARVGNACKSTKHYKRNCAKRPHFLHVKGQTFMVISNGVRWWNNATICTHCPTGAYLYSIFTVVWISPCSTHQVFNFCKYLWSSVAISKPITTLVFQKHTWKIADVIMILCNFGWNIDVYSYCKNVI